MEGWRDGEWREEWTEGRMGEGNERAGETEKARTKYSTKVKKSSEESFPSLERERTSLEREQTCGPTAGPVREK